jgi:hypothetical protein
VRQPGQWRFARRDILTASLIHGRRAFTLAEVVVACVVFAIGVLALQAAATLVLRQSQDARNQMLSSEVAAMRFESFVHAPCAENTAGTELVRGVRSEWSTGSLPGAEARLSSQTITFARGGFERTDTYHGAYRCR